MAISCPNIKILKVLVLHDFVKDFQHFCNTSHTPAGASGNFSEGFCQSYRSPAGHLHNSFTKGCISARVS
jgi:hypothetical protein